MSNGAITVTGRANEDGSYSCLGRATAIEGSGNQVAGDVGKPIQQADVSSITAKIFDLGTDPDSATATQVSSGPAVVVSSVIYDSLQTTGWDLTKDPHGYNFRVDIGPTYIPTGGHWYQAEFKIVLTSGIVIWARYKILAVSVFFS